MSWESLIIKKNPETGDKKEFFQFKTSTGKSSTYKVEWFFDGTRQHKCFTKQFNHAKRFYISLDINNPPETELEKFAFSK